MTDKTLEDYQQELKRLLQQHPDRGWIFGVCATIARRTGWELWIVRVVAIVMLLWFTLITGLAYFCLAMAFHETRPGAQSKMSRWARRADQLTAAIGRGLRNFMREYRGRDAYPHKKSHADETFSAVDGS